MPPLRRAILEDLQEHPRSRTSDVRVRLNKPWETVDRQLQALHMLGVLACDEVEINDSKSRWYYSLAPDIDPEALCTRNLSLPIDGEMKREREKVCTY
jgi:hypothetical protein